MPEDGNNKFIPDISVQIERIAQISAVAPGIGLMAWTGYKGINMLASPGFGLVEAVTDIKPTALQTPMLPVDGPVIEKITRPQAPTSMEVWRWELRRNVERKRSQNQ